MRRAITLSILLALVSLNAFGIARSGALVERASLTIRSGQLGSGVLKLDALFYETNSGRTEFPLEFSCFTPIMEVGPTRNVAFWNLPRKPAYDVELIATWRLYARLHEQVAGYGYEAAQAASRTGMPIVRPLWLVDPTSRDAWSNWWTYLYGPDLLVSPIWEKGKREQEVYLPRGSRWRDAWHRENVYDGGQTIRFHAELYQIPLFIRDGSPLAFGDLSQQYRESLAIAQKKPDLGKLDSELREWFERNKR